MLCTIRFRVRRRRRELQMIELDVPVKFNVYRKDYAFLSTHFREPSDSYVTLSKFLSAFKIMLTTNSTDIKTPEFEVNSFIRFFYKTNYLT